MKNISAFRRFKKKLNSYVRYDIIKDEKHVFAPFFSCMSSTSKNNFLGGTIMRKYVTLWILTILFVFMLTGCGEKYSYEETELEAVVIQCQEGTYHLNASDIAIANMYLVQKNYGLWSMYMTLANTNGTYDYNVTINIDDNNYTVVREEQYEVGQYITITRVNTYNKDSQLINTEYK